MSENKWVDNIGLAWLTTLMFVGLKLSGSIDWNWWWVFSPLWAPVILGIVIVAIFWMITNW